MTNVSEFLYQLYAKAMVLLVYFLIELVLIVQYLRSETQRTITTKQYLNFIEEKNPTICYTKRRRVLQQVEEAEHEGEDEAEECRVCLSELEEGDKLRNLKCKHAFHKDCLDKWLRESCPTCPLCRSKVVPDDVAAKYHLFQNQVVDNHDAGTHNQLILLLYSIRGASILHRYL